MKRSGRTEIQWLLTICVLLSGLANAAVVSGQGTWESTLLPRDLDGDKRTAEAFYDRVLNVTWLADTTYSGSGMDWWAANDWAANLDPYGSGIDGWRLPRTGPTNGSTYDYSLAYDGSTDKGYNISMPGTVSAGSTGSEMAHLYYNTLGNLSGYDANGVRRPLNGVRQNHGPFVNYEIRSYWSETDYEPGVTQAWLFWTGSGYQVGWWNGDTNPYAWAVHDGDVGGTVVPIPSAAISLVSSIVSLGLLVKGVSSA